MGYCVSHPKARIFASGAILQFLATQVLAAGFQVNPTASSVARSMGGNGIIGEDLGDMFFNPAGLSLQQADRSVEFSGTFLKLENEFIDQASMLLRPSVMKTTGTNEPSDDTGTPIGAFYAQRAPWNDKFMLGIGLTVPFGLSNTYEDDWIGRYHATASELKVFDLNLAGSYELSPSLMLGFGFSVQKAEATLNQAIPTGGSADVFSSIEGDNADSGFSLGLIFKPHPDLKLGVSYRSKVEHELEGSQTLTLAGNVLSDNSATAPLILPESLHLSLHYQPVNKPWSIALGARETQWSRFRELEVYVKGVLLSSSPQEWENSWTSGISVDYKLAGGSKIVASLGYDETPVPNAQRRGALVPDADRKVVGLGYEVPTLFGCEGCTGYLGFHRTMIGDRRIENSNAYSRLEGYFESNGTNVYSMHLQYEF